MSVNIITCRKVVRPSQPVIQHRKVEISFKKCEWLLTTHTCDGHSYTHTHTHTSRVEEAKRVMEQQMLEEMERKKQIQEEEEQKNRVRLVHHFVVL